MLAGAHVALLCTASGAEPWGTPYDRFFDLADVQVETGLQDDGTEYRQVMTPGDVEVAQHRNGGRIRTVVTDKGQGPVLCLWNILIEVRFVIENCENIASDDRLDRVINRQNDFIARNWVEPITVADVEQMIGKREEKFLRGQAQEDTCRMPDVIEYVQYMLRNIEKFESGLDKSLSIPRLPASNPCL